MCLWHDEKTLALAACQRWFYLLLPIITSCRYQIKHKRDHYWSIRQ